jgi:hypothetical protein
VGKIDKWGLSTVGVCINSLGESTVQAWRCSGISTVWAYQQFGRINSLGVSTVSYCLFMKCKETTYSHSLSPDLSLDTHINALLSFIKVF